jgi:hypothetical protein
MHCSAWLPPAALLLLLLLLLPRALPLPRLRLSANRPPRLLRDAAAIASADWVLLMLTLVLMLAVDLLELLLLLLLLAGLLALLLAVMLWPSPRAPSPAVPASTPRTAALQRDRRQPRH